MKGFAKKAAEKRITAILVLFFLFASYLLFNIFRLDYFNYSYYKEKTYDQVTTSSKLLAKRGTIYDANMNVLAESGTSWRVFVSTKDIKTACKEEGQDYFKSIAYGIAPLLSMDGEKLYTRLKGSSVLDVTIKRSCTREEYAAVLDFISKNSLERLVFTEPQSNRYYPQSTLAAHVLGFTGSDSQGLYGLEYYYDDILSGTDGYYVYAKDAGGRALDTEFSSYIPAEDGYSIVTTIDSYVQEQLEAVIEAARVNSGAQNRVTGIVMDTASGAILAMATSSPFDPNNPFVLDALSEEKLNQSGLAVGSDEYNKYKSTLMQQMWSNKAISETYEPGSTFKIVTVCSALDMGAVSTSSTYSCKGYHQVGGYRIKCHKTTGHGSGFSLAYGLQMSCNPCMMSVAESIGAMNFYNYVERFGYFEKTGIDLPGEATTIFHKAENIGSTELATASFGQRFKVSVINHLTAISAVANNGNLVTPYLVDKVIDSQGNIISKHETQIRRNVISEEVADTVSQILIDGVNGDGGAKNAGVEGYDIAAKTGTSEKFDILDENGNSYLRIGSTVAYSINGENGISAIIVVDEPTSQVKYGSVIAAPYISMLMEKILPYLEFQTKNSTTCFTVDDYCGMNVNSVKSQLNEKNIAYEIIGDGETVLAQTPSANDTITYPLSKILIYTENIEESSATVPDLLGLSAAEAIKTALNAGLNIHITGGTSAYPDGDDIVTEQSLPAGTAVKRGSVIILRIINTSYED